MIQTFSLYQECGNSVENQAAMYPNFMIFFFFLLYIRPVFLSILVVDSGRGD